jgi:hypothetical protein
MEPNQVNILASTVFGDLEQIQDAQESRFSRHARSNVRKANRFDRVHLDFTFFHGIAPANSDTGAQPEADTAIDFAEANALTKTLGERHRHEDTPILYLRKGASSGIICAATSPWDGWRDRTSEEE